MESATGLKKLAARANDNKAIRETVIVSDQRYGYWP